MGRYFGTDGIRGVVGDTLTLAMAYHIGRALKLVLNAEEAYVGTDTRLSKESLKAALFEGAKTEGITLYDAGILPTPALAAYSAHHHVVTVMVTASHNPYTDNGIKVFDRGHKLTHDQELAIEALFEEDSPIIDETLVLPQTDEVLAHYTSLFHVKPSNINVMIDTANGALFEVAPMILKAQAKRLKVLHNTPNGRNINFDCGSTHIEKMIQNADCRGVDVGFSFDGDGDRVLAMDCEGRVFTGDHLIFVLAQYLKHRGNLVNNTVVLTVMSNPGVLNTYKRSGIHVITTPVGDKYVSEAMLEGDYLLGGENSGHIIDANHLMTGDGLWVASRIIRIMDKTKKTLHELTQAIKYYPEKLTNLKGIDGKVLEHTTIKKLVHDITERFEDLGKVLLRKSGTEALIRVYVSHKDETTMLHAHDQLVNAIKDVAKGV